MEKLIFYSDDFEAEINKIVDILFENEYFGFRNSALLYASKIYDFIEENIDSPAHRTSPSKFRKHGMFFIKYKANEQTTWYIFFDRKENRYLVNFILNNHSQNFSELL